MYVFRGLKNLYGHPKVVAILHEFAIELPETDHVLRSLGSLSCSSMDKFAKEVLDIPKHERLRGRQFKEIRK